MKKHEVQIFTVLFIVVCISQAVGRITNTEALLAIITIVLLNIMMILGRILNKIV